MDLAGLAGLTPAGVICEIMNNDGTMARVPDLMNYCGRHGLKMVTVADLIAYSRRYEKLVERGVSARLTAKRERMGHTLHHQGLPLDEEMLQQGRQREMRPVDDIHTRPRPQ